MRRKIARNTLFNAIGFAWQGLALLALVPLIVHYVGVERYGVWVLLVALVSYFDLADISSGATLTKYIAQYYTLNDQPSLRKVLNNGALFYCGLTLIAIAIGIPLGPPLLRLFHIPPDLQAEAHFVYYGALGVWCVTTLGNAWKSVFTGLQRMDILNVINVFAVLVKVIGAFLVLHNGYGLKGLILSDLFATSFALLATCACLAKFYPELLPRLGYDGPVMKQILGFGARLNVSSLSEMVNMQFDKILLSRLLGVQYVAYYDIGARLLKYARAFLLMLVSALAPAVAELDAHDDKQRLKSLYGRSSGYSIFLTLWVLGLLFVVAPNLLQVWMGPGYGVAALTMRILCLGYAVNTLTSVPCAFAIGLGRPDYLMRVALVQLGLNIILSVVLVLGFGYYGAAIGTTAALASGSLYFIASFGRLMGESLLQYSRSRLIAPLMCATVAGAATLFCSSLLTLQFPFIGEVLRGAILLIGNSVLFSVLFLALVLKFDAALAEEWGLMRGRVVGGSKRFS